MKRMILEDDEKVIRVNGNDWAFDEDEYNNKIIVAVNGTNGVSIVKRRTTGKERIPYELVLIPLNYSLNTQCVNVTNVRELIAFHTVYVFDNLAQFASEVIDNDWKI